MKIELIKSPFDAHSNILYGFIKKSLKDENIYDTSEIAYPFSNKRKKYQIRLSDCNIPVKIKFNGQDYISFNGGENFDFYIAPFLGQNTIEVFDLSVPEKSYCNFVFNTYNIHLLLAFISFKFKQIWNNLYQAQANTYYDDNIIQDLDGNYLTPEYQYTKTIASLLNTKRYSGLSNSQYYTFLHNVFEINKHAGTFKSFYLIQNALASFINKIDIIPAENYLVFDETLPGKVYRDPEVSNKLKIFPNYLDVGDNEGWGMLPHYNQSMDGTTNYVSHVYIDNEKYGDDSTSWGALKIKYSNDAEFYKREYNYEDVFSPQNIYEDEDGKITGFEGGKYVILRKPPINNVISDIEIAGDIGVENSARLITDPDYNIVDLGTKYKDGISSLKVFYDTYEIPRVLGKITRDTTTGEIENISLSAHPVDGDVGDKKYLGNIHNNYGFVVVVVRVSQKMDNELKDIVNNLVRDVLPLHIGYYIVFSTIGVWDYWGDTHLTFADFDTTGIFANIKFSDLK